MYKQRNANHKVAVRTIVPVNAFIVSVALYVLSAQALGDERIVLRAVQDVTATEMMPDRLELEITEYSLSAGVGRGGRPAREGRSRAYLQFDIGALPKADAFQSVSVDSATLHLFVMSHVLTPDGTEFSGKRYLVSVSGCEDTDWMETTMTWNTRVCADEWDSLDTRIVDGASLPVTQLWDVTEAFGHAVSKEAKGTTLIVDAQRLLNCGRDPLQGLGCPEVERIGFLRFASREREDLGISVVPRVVVAYSTAPTTLKSFQTTTLSVLSVVAMLLGLYGGIRGLKKRKAATDAPVS